MAGTGRAVSDPIGSSSRGRTTITRPRQPLVVTIAYDGLGMFEFGIVTEAFALPRPELGVPWYRFQVCSAQPGSIRALGGVIIEIRSGLRALRDADTIVVPGWTIDETPRAALLDAIRRAYARGARVVSICSGVFVLAAAGLLDGKRASTHWRYADRLSERFPRIRVERDVLYVDEGRVLTSAGSAAGIDLCLHIIRKDYGAEIANRVARRWVVPPHRDGGQSQYVTEAMRADSATGLAPLLQWAQGNLHRDLTIRDLARRARMSERSFARHFGAATGTTPHQWLVHQRVIAAQRQLETTSDGIDRVAERVGLGTAATLRHHFRHQLGTAPLAYRKRFTTLAK
jgi:AraC family transcriptional activator FtrA